MYLLGNRVQWHKLTWIENEQKIANHYLRFEFFFSRIHWYFVINPINVSLYRKLFVNVALNCFQ